MNSSDKKIIKEILDNGVKKELLNKRVNDIHINKIIEILNKLNLIDKVKRCI